MSVDFSFTTTAPVSMDCAAAEAALRVVRAHVEMQKSRDSLELETHKLWYYDMYIWSGRILYRCILYAS